MPLLRVARSMRRGQYCFYTSVRAQFSRTIANVPNPLPATFLRGGTSKGIFLKRSDLPKNQEEWAPIFLGIMGSPDYVHGRQLNGMGGGVSSLSKVCVVGPAEQTAAESQSEVIDVDVEYTFCQVGIKDSTLDYSGNCGNLSSMIGVFAVDEGLCTSRIHSLSPGLGTVRSFNTNTRKRIDTTFPIVLQNGVQSPKLDLPQATVAGVPGKSSRIDLDFVSPAGARTGKLLPTGRPVDKLSLVLNGEEHEIEASLVDATNPTVFVLSEDLAQVLGVPDPLSLNYTSPETETLVETIRQSGAEHMGLDPRAKAQPKIAILSSQNTTDVGEEAPHIIAHAYSMGVLHKAIPMTLGLCLGVAARTDHTLPWRIASKARQALMSEGGGKREAGLNEDLIRIKHPSGTVDVGAEISRYGEVKSAKVVRTGRRLMKGVVWW